MPETANSDWAVLAVAIVTGVFAWLATWLTNRRSVSASKSEDDNSPPESLPLSMQIDTRDTVHDIKHDLKNAHQKLDAALQKLDLIERRLPEHRDDRRR